MDTLQDHFRKARWCIERAAHCQATNQPGMAALYERNALQALADARRLVRRERIARRPLLAWTFLGEDLGGFLQQVGRGFEEAIQAFSGLAREATSASQADYVLVGPGGAA